MPLIARAGFVAVFLTGAVALETIEWKRRSIYQVITDRFAKEEGKADTCDILEDMGQKCPYGAYCGGSFYGIVDKLDYIQGMGFDAIWISPVVANTACGYHGYWTQYLHKINEHFGGEKGLKTFVDEAHKRGIAVMFDSVVNHVGPATVAAANANSYEMYEPFNKQEYYHGGYFDHTPAEQAPLQDGQHLREVGWMGYAAELPDLAQEKPEVAKILVDWVKGLRAEYGIDGFRMDALPYVNKSFYQLLKKEALNGVFTTGEVVIGGKHDAFAANYQFQMPDAKGDDAADNVEGPVIDSVINYGLNDALKHVFQVVDKTVDQGPMHSKDVTPFDLPLSYYAEKYAKMAKTYKDVGALANFVSVHDQPRWMYLSPERFTYKNAYVTTFFIPGVPINYYGDEQGVRGGNMDNTCRPPLWRTGYDESHEMYAFTKSVIFARKKMFADLSDEEIDTLKHFTGTAYALTFQRGAAVVITEKPPPAAVVDMEITVSTDYSAGTVLCDALDEAFCATVSDGGIFTHKVTGTPHVLFPMTTSLSATAKLQSREGVSVVAFVLAALAGLSWMAWRAAQTKSGDKSPYMALA